MSALAVRDFMNYERAFPFLIINEKSDAVCRHLGQKILSTFQKFDSKNIREQFSVNSVTKNVWE